MPYAVAAAGITAGGAYLSAKEAGKGGGGGGGQPTQSWHMLGMPQRGEDGELLRGADGNLVYNNSPIGNGFYDSHLNRLSTAYTSDQQAQRDAFQHQVWQGAQGGTHADRQAADWSKWAGAAQNQAGYDHYLQASMMPGQQHAARADMYTQQGQQQAQRSFMGQMGIGDRQAGVSNALQGYGMGLMGTDFQGVADDRLAMLREQARPQEERAQNSMAQKLFSMGQLGTEGGARNIEAFGQGQAQADLARQLQSQDMANTLRQQDRALGSQMFGMGDTMARTAGGIMSSALQANQQRQGMAQNIYDRSMATNQLGNQRAQERLMAAQGMFNFGSGAQDANLQRMVLGQSGVQGVNAEMRENLALTSNIANAGQGGNAGTGGGGSSGIGAALSGFGTSMMNNPDMFSGFGGGGRNTNYGSGGGGVDVGSSNAWADNFNFG